MTKPDEQVKEEIKKKVFPAFDALLRKEATADDFSSDRSEKEVFHIDRDDKQKFLDAITIEDIECSGHTNLNNSEHDEANDTSEAHQFPGQPTRHEERGARAEGEAHANFGNSTAGIGANTSFGFRRDEHSDQAPTSVPAHSTRTTIRSTSVLTHKLHLVVQDDCSIRVYSHTPVRAGAGIGGGLGIVAGGAGGAAAGALIGSIVPIAGTIIGGIIGGIIGVVAGGTAGAGVGAGSGAIHSNRLHGTARAYEVFQKLSDFLHDEENNICRCTIIVNTVCPAEHQNLEPTRGN